MDNRHKFGLAAQRLRQARGPVFLALAAKRVGTGSGAGGQQLLFNRALGYHSTSSNLIKDIPWLNLDAAPFITMKLGLLFEATMTQRDIYEEYNLTHSMAELIGVWHTSPTCTDDERDTARRAILGKLRAHPPSKEDLIQGFAYIRDCLVVSNGDKARHPKAEVIETYGIPKTVKVDKDVSSKTCEMLAMRVLAYPISLLVDGEFKERLSHYATLSTANYDDMPADSKVELKPEWETLWRELDEDSILSFYELQPQVHPNVHASWCASALLMFPTVLIKGENITEAYVESRSNRMKPLIPNADMDAYFNVTQCRQLSQNYPIRDLKVDDIYSHLISLYTVSSTYGVDPISWMIEQSAGHNIASASAVADLIYKTPYLNVDMMMRTIPFSQFQALARLSAAMQHDRFASTLTPPVKVRDYPDLAHLATSLIFALDTVQKRGGRGRQSKYMGRPDAMATKSVAELNQLAAILQDEAATYTSSMTSSTVHAKSMLVGYDVFDDQSNDEYAFIVPISLDGKCKTRAEWMAEHNAMTEASDHQQSNAELDPNLPMLPFVPSVTLEDLEAPGDDLVMARRQWPAPMRQSCRGTKRISKQELYDAIQAKQSTKSSAFKQLMISLRNVLLQEELARIPDGELAAHQRRKKLPTTTLNLLNVMGVDPDPEWTKEPEPEPIVTADPNVTDQAFLNRLRLGPFNTKGTTTPTVAVTGPSREQ